MPGIRFQKLDGSVELPQLATQGSVGLDLKAHLISETGRASRTLIPPNNARNVPTGLKIELPHGYFGMVCSRSGMASGALFVANAPGIIDPDYRGELRVLLYNGGIESQYIQHGDRIAQLIIAPVVMQVWLEEVTRLSPSERGEKGFGSTGR